jgi:hypothetical protein
VPELLILIVLSAATYRLTRLAILDDVFNTPRDKIHDWLLEPEQVKLWRVKLQALLACFPCLSVWFAGFVCWPIGFLYPIPLDAVYWLAVATLALIFHIVIDQE